MNENDNEFPDYITFGRTFENYKWYKPLLVIVVAGIAYLAFLLAGLLILTSTSSPDNIIPLLSGNYESVSSEIGTYIGFLSVAIITPSLYVASRIVRDRPFSSYSSSRGGWNWKLFFKCLTIPIAVYLIFDVINSMISGHPGKNTLTIPFFIICLILVPLQSIAEEYLFRGYLMQTLGSWFKIPVLALAVHAALFALGHTYSILGIVATLISGLLWGFIAWKTHGLEAVSALHSVNNFSGTIAVALGVEVATSTITPINFITSTAVTLIAALALYYIGNKQGWFNEKT